MDESSAQGVRGIASGGIILGPGEGRTIPGTDAITLIATGEESGGFIGVFECNSPPGDGPPRHVHHTQGPERLVEKFVKLTTEGKGVNRSVWAGAWRR
jgi:hypothetical protein